MPNNNDLPSWMQTPNDDESENGDDSSSLPPWLRDNDVLETPPAPSELPPAGDLPPWLRDDFKPLTPPPAPVLGGEAIDEDYLASADTLPDTVDSDLTYDEWMAQQIEERRPKSIEEEVPDLLADVSDAPPASGTPNATGQLPDWFLGLEELDTSEAPEWFKAIGDTGALVDEPAAEIPPWMQGMVEPEAPESEESTPREDNLGDFFRSLGNLPVEPEEELPELDWISGEPVGAADEDTPDDNFFVQFSGETKRDERLPTDDLFAELRAGLPEIDGEDTPSEPADPGLDTVASLDRFLSGSDPTVQVPKVGGDDDDLPPIEIDDSFFTELTNERTGEPGDIEEPDLSWFLDSAAEQDADADEPLGAAAPLASEMQDAPEAPDDNTLSWLNEIQGIVSSATRGRQQDDDPFEAQATDDWELPAASEARGRADEFFWTKGADANSEPDETEPAPDWLDAVADVPADAQPEEPIEPQAQTPSFTAPADQPEEPRQPSLLTGRLRALIDRQEAEASPSAAEPPTPEPEAAAVEDDLPRQYDEAPPTVQRTPTDELIPEDELQGGWLTDDLLADINADETPVAQAPAPSTPPDDTDFFTLLERDADANVLDPSEESEPTFSESEGTAVDETVADEELPDETAFAWQETLEEPELPTFDEVDWEDADDEPVEALDSMQPSAVVIEAPELPPFDALEWQDMDAEGDQPEAASQTDAADEDDDFFASFGMQTQPKTGVSPDFDSVAEWLEAEALTADDYGVTDEPAPMPEAEFDNDFAVSGVDSQADAETPDFWERAAEPLDEPIDSEPDAERAIEDEMPDFDSLTVFDVMEANAAETDQPETPTIEDIDSYLASLQAQPPKLKPTTARLLDPTNVDLDNLLSEPLPDRQRGLRDLPEDADITPAQLDWLSETSVGEVSAAAMVRKRKDERSADDLSARLRKLRERGEHNLTAEENLTAADPLAKMLPGVVPALIPAPLQSGTPSLVQSLALTPEQARKADLLKTMLAIDTTPPAKPSAIDATYDTAYPSELDDISGLREAEQTPAAKEMKPAVRRRARRRGMVIPLERLLITAVVALAVILPFFVDDLRLGSLPPQEFGDGSTPAAAFARIEALEPGDLVLVGVEYGSTGAAELDGMTDDLLRHILIRGARPVVISGNPIGLLRATHLIASTNADSAFLERIGAEQPLAANADYYIVRYLPGSVIGLRAFSQDSASLLLTDIQGQLTGLEVNSMRDFALIAVITESADDLRAYAEQVAPLADAPMIAAVGYAAAPLVEPYLDARLSPAVPGVEGLLVGYRDAYTYNAMLASVDAVNRADIPTPIPPAPTPRAPVEPQDEAPVIAPEATPDSTAEATSEATEPPDDQTFAVVNATTAVNMRSGPGTGNRVVTTVAPGTRVIVLGANAAGDWINVRLDDGQEGWISAALVRIEEAQSSDGKRFAKPSGQVIDPDMTPSLGATDTPRPTRTPAPTDEPTDEAAAEATAEPEASPTPLPGFEGAAGTPPMFTLAYRDERWYAMTLGIIVSASVIALGAVINVIRSIFRRRRAR